MMVAFLWWMSSVSWWLSVLLIWPAMALIASGLHNYHHEETR